jgi:hypothetical protein
MRPSTCSGSTVGTPIPAAHHRKKRLERLIPASLVRLTGVPCLEAKGRELFEAACRLDLEGIRLSPRAPYPAATCRLDHPARFTT